MVGLDVTMDRTLSAARMQEINAMNVCPLLNALVARWAEYYRASLPVLYDPVAVASVFSDILHFERKKMRVKLEGKERGVTLESADGNPIQVAVLRDDGAFEREFFPY